MLLAIGLLFATLAHAQGGSPSAGYIGEKKPESAAPTEAAPSPTASPASSMPQDPAQPSLGDAGKPSTGGEAKTEEPPKSDEPDNEGIPKRIVKTVQSRSSLSFILGLSSITYKETGYPDFSEVALTPKISYRYLLDRPGWDLGITGYGTALQLASDQPGVVVRFFGLNVRLGKATNLLPSPWRLSILMGGYYTTMMVSGSPFGFSGLMGPQIYPVVRRVLANGDIISASFKYSPIGAVFSLTDRETALGLTWTRTLENGHPLSVFLDLANLRVSNGPTSAESSSRTLSFSYGW